MLFVLTGGMFFITFQQVQAGSGSGSYGFSQIEYFSAGAKEKNPGSLFTADQLWSEIKYSADGSAAIYRPPEVVINFLEQPNTENAKHYIQWNTARLEKIAQAQKVLQQTVEIK